MKLRTRLQRLERTAAACAPAPPSPDSATESAAYLAYLEGAGPRPPDPPCPAGFDPAAWESRMRLGRCIDARLLGELGDAEYLPRMDAGERWNVDGSVEVIRLFMNGYPENQQLQAITPEVSR